MADVKIIDREQEIVFTNYTDKDFDGRWNKKTYRLKAKKSYYLPFYMAELFGKHLVDRELNERAAKEIKEIRNIDPRIDQKEVDRRERGILTNKTLRQELMDKCVQLTEPKELDFITPRLAPTREVVLKTQQRSAEMVKEGKVVASDLGPKNQPKEEAPEESFEGLKDEKTDKK